MACYKCGSPEGNDARLCPACNSKRSQEHEDRVAQLAIKTEDIPHPPLTQQQVLLLTAGSFLVLLSVWWAFHPSNSEVPVTPVAAVPTSTPLEIAFSNCLRKTLGPPTEEQDPEAVTEATNTCNILKAPCDIGTESTECKLFLTEHSGTPLQEAK